MTGARLLTVVLTLVVTGAQAQTFGRHTEANDCAAAIAGNVTDTVISVVCGLSPEETQDLVTWALEVYDERAEARNTARQEELLAAIAAIQPADSVVPPEMVAKLFALLGREDVPPERRADTFAEVLQEVEHLNARLRMMSSDRPEVEALRKTAADAIARLDFDTAAASLEEAEALVRAARHALQEQLATDVRLEAELIAERASVERSRLNVSEAARLYDTAAELVRPHDAEGARGYLLEAALAWQEHGDTRGDNAALVTAVARWREIVSKTARAKEPDNWAVATGNLGNALATLGGREPGTARLEEAVAAYHGVLEEWTRNRVPLYSAMTQMNLGATLAELGARESGTARLEEAVAAYRAALEERTRELVPLDWAMTQMNLGVSLRALGAREPGTARLEEAVTASRAALEEMTRDRVPLDWARAQMNLGVSLRALGAREPGTARLEDAVTASRAALEEMTRDRVPLDWAMTQMNLGSALADLGAREPGTARLEEAVAASRAALEEMTRDRVPLDWARAQVSLGVALRTLGAREPGTARLEEAVAASSAALEEMTRDRVPLDWAMTQMNLGLALLSLGERSQLASHFTKAEASFASAAEVLIGANHHEADRAVQLADKAASLLQDEAAQ